MRATGFFDSEGNEIVSGDRLNVSVGNPSAIEDGIVQEDVVTWAFHVDLPSGRFALRDVHQKSTIVKETANAQA